MLRSWGSRLGTMGRRCAVSFWADGACAAVMTTLGLSSGILRLICGVLGFVGAWFAVAGGGLETTVGAEGLMTLGLM